MNWRVKLSSQAEKYFNKLIPSRKQQFKQIFLELSTMINPKDHRHVKPLIGRLNGFYRLRINDYRVIISFIEDDKIIAIVNILPRGDAYK
ncbi:MAG: type II toxin-antitoxin system RelE/ParE family toxin [Nitrospirae bacterium]|nr:type II toxin-antitoxin system RelE/ParE family toxin [Nitrospirota bacterium]